MHPDGFKQANKGGLWRLSVVHFLIALILLMVVSPFVLDSPDGKVIEAALITLVFMSAVLAVGGRHRTLFVAAVLVAPAVVGTWLDHFQPDLWPREWTLAAGALFAAFVIMHLLRFILKAPRVDFQVLCAGISTYLMLALLWAFGYVLVARLVPPAFVVTIGTERHDLLEGFDALYFSFCTLTTVGYGDIVPVARIARQLAVMEATTGTLFITVLIARLVSLYSTAEASSSAQATPGNAPVTNSNEENKDSRL